MLKNRSMILKLMLGITVSLVCLYFALRGIDFQSLLDILKSVKVSFVILFLIILTLTVFFRALMYYRFLSRLKRVSLFSIFEGLMIGYMVNSLFPLRAGDVAKAYIIGKMNGVSKTYTFTLTIIERLFDLISLLISFALLLCFIRLDSRYMTAAKLLGGLTGAALLFIILSIKCGDRVIRSVDALGFFLPERLRGKIKEKLRIVQEGFSLLCDWRDIVFILGIFAIIWTGYIAVSYVTGLSVGLNLTLPMIMLLIITVSLGGAIAASPGNLGVHQYACVLVFSLYHLSREEALSFSLVQNTLVVILPIVLGWLFLLHTNMSLSSLSSEENPEVRSQAQE